MIDHLTPLAVCERLIGPKPELERIAGYRPKAAYGWERSARTRAGGGLPPRAQQAILKHIREQRLPIPADWLIEGATLKEVYQVLDEIKRRPAA
ncbi:MAG: hypothetical protein KDK11_14760 [Maritimibacter sp.]|nr:hypothetical protein [Maritimibacter sp.]